MADAEQYRRFFHPSPDHPYDDVQAAEAAFAATPALSDGARLDAADDGWSHVPLPSGVLHPALIDVAAEAYGVSAAEVRDAADHGAIAGGPLCRLVPVAPRALRPREPGVGGRAIDNAVDARLRLLLRRAAMARHLAERGEGEAIVDAANGMLQRAFDALVRQVVDDGTLWTPAPAEIARLQPGGAPAPATGAWIDPPDPRRPIGCAVAGERLLLVFPFAVVLVDRDGAVRSVAAATDLQLSYAADGIARFWRDGRAYAWSLDDGRWLDAWPPGASACFVEERHERAWLVDARAGRTRELFEVVDHPRVARASPDGAYFWVEDVEESGGIFDVARGLRQLSVSDLRLPASDDDAGGWPRAFHWGSPDVAFAFLPDERLRLFIVDTLHDGGAHRLPPADAAAFSVGAGELLCADRDEARLYTLADAAPPELRTRVDLAPLAALVAPRR